MNVLLKEFHASPFERLLEAAFTLTELSATDDEGWERARDNIRKAATAYAESKKQPNGHNRQSA